MFKVAGRMSMENHKFREVAWQETVMYYDLLDNTVSVARRNEIVNILLANRRYFYLESENAAVITDCLSRITTDTV
jgi:hypothetical protein